MALCWFVKIQPANEIGKFTITWKNNSNSVSNWFTQEAPITPGELTRLWEVPSNSIDMGEKLFCFLDGNASALAIPLLEAQEIGERLILHLNACKEVADWPFELLAQKGEFLLPGKLHLVRQVSSWGEGRQFNTHNRPLKLLFMVSAPLDVKPELDFEAEEEAIFKITEPLPIQMDVEDSGSLEGLKRRLVNTEYDVLHLSCHAVIDSEGNSVLLMESETGHTRLVSPKELWDEALINSRIKLLCLSACVTANFANELVEKFHIPAVLGWGRSVTDEQARLVSKTIYQQLSCGNSLLDAIQRARYELSNHFIGTISAWPWLRLFCNFLPLQPLVREGQRMKPKTKNLAYIYLKGSHVKVLKEGFVGRRRPLQKSLTTLFEDNSKIGVLIHGTGGLGKSCLAGKICERFRDVTLIIVQGLLDEQTLENAIKDAFIITQDEKGQKILSDRKRSLVEKLPELCTHHFKEKHYLFLFDDFEQNIELNKLGEPIRLLPRCVELLRVLLHYLTYAAKQSQLIITSRYDFSLTERDRDIVEEKMAKVCLAGFQGAELYKKQRQLNHICNYQNSTLIPQILDAGMGNPRLLEALNELVNKLAQEEVPHILESIKKEQEEFVEKHLLRELLNCGGKELQAFLKRLCVYRLPVLFNGVQQVSEKVGVQKLRSLLKRGERLSVIEFDHVRNTYFLTPHLREELLNNCPDLLACHYEAYLYYKNLCKTVSDIEPVLWEESIYHALECQVEDFAVVQAIALVKYLRQSLADWEARRIGLWVLNKKQPDSAQDASLLNETALTLKNLGEYDTALSYLELALSLQRQLNGENHHSVVHTLNNLGAVYNVYTQSEKALAFYQQAIEIAQRNAYEQTHPDMMANLWNNLGTLWHRLTDYEKARDYFQKALKCWESMGTTKNLEIASVKGNLGAVYANLGKHQEAEHYYLQGLELDRLELGEAHPDVAIDLQNLGACYFDMGLVDKAIEYYQEAFKLLYTIYGKNHFSVAVVLSNLGKVYFDRGDVQKAKKYYRMALHIYDDLYGDENSHSKVIQSQLTELYKKG